MKLLTTYLNGNVKVTLYDDGTKIRETEDDEFRPKYPENCDMTLSTVCGNGCEFCYMNYTLKGEYADYRKYDFLHHMFPGMELAINLNFPPHPYLYDFLVMMRDQGVYVNATINENHFMKIRNRKWLQSMIEYRLLWGIGISYTGQSDNKEFIKAVKEIPTAIIHLIAGLADQKTIDALKDNELKVLILGYKDTGRGKGFWQDNQETIQSNIQWLMTKLPELTELFRIVSFDNLAIEQLYVKEFLSPDTWKERYQGEEGSQTFYIDLVNGKFAKDSMSRKQFDIGDKSLKEMFDMVRTKKESPGKVNN